MKIDRLSEMRFRFTAENRQDIFKAYQISRSDNYIFPFEGKTYRVISIDHEDPESKSLDYLVLAEPV